MINSLNICSIAPTHRGCRGGTRKQRHHESTTARTIPVLNRPRAPINKCHRTGSNHHNLHHIKCVSNFSDSNLSVCVWNSHSIRNKTAILCDYVLDKDIDVTFLTETWLYPDDHAVIGECTPAGYSFINFPHGGSDFHGGIGVIYKTQLNFMIIESPVISTTFEHGLVTDQARSVLFVVVYRPPPSQINKFRSADFLTEFDNFVTEIDNIPGKHLFLGDFNVHIDVPSKPEASKFLTTLSSSGLHQFVSGPTHNHGHTLDLVIGRQEDLLVSDCMTHDNAMSDHYAIHFKLNRMKIDPPTICTEVRDFRSIDAEVFTCDLNDKLTPLLKQNNVNDQIMCYNTIIRQVLDDHCPCKSLERSVRPRMPWYNSSIYEDRCVKHLLERKWRKKKMS